MADLPTTLSFKAPAWLADWLRRKALADQSDRRAVGAVIRRLLIRIYQEERAQEAPRADGQL